MIVLLKNQEEKRETRIKLYKDDVFIIAHEAIKETNPSLSIEEVFATADSFTNFLLEKDITAKELMQYEIDDLKAEAPDETSFYSILAVTLLKLSALRKIKENAENVGSVLIEFCQEYVGWNELLKKFSQKEYTRCLDDKRINLLTYELKCIDNNNQLKDENKIIADIVKTTCGYSVNVMQNIENVLSELNDNKEHRFQKELDFLRSARQQKSENKVNIEKVNDIHGNSTVNIGSK